MPVGLAGVGMFLLVPDENRECQECSLSVPEMIERSSHAKTALKLLANLEHEFRIFWHSIRLGVANGQYERHLPVSRRQI